MLNVDGLSWTILLDLFVIREKKDFHDLFVSGACYMYALGEYDGMVKSLSRTLDAFGVMMASTEATKSRGTTKVHTYTCYFHLIEQHQPLHNFDALVMV